jgi:apolipoprotein N-acyltransferase
MFLRSRVLTPIVAAAASGALLFLSTNNGRVWPLAWISVVPLLWLAYGDTPEWQVGVASFCAYLIGTLNLYQAYGAIIIALAPYLPLLAAAFAVCVLFARVTYRRLPPLAALLAFPVAWTTCEYATALWSPNGSYVSWAYSQAFVPVLIQGASLLGMWFVTFLLAIVNTAIAFLLRQGRRAAIVVGVVAALGIANLAFGASRLAAPQPAAVRFGLITDDALPFAQIEAQSKRISAQYAAYAASLARDGVEAVVLPEKTVVLNPAWSSVVAPYRRAAGGNSSIVVGFEEHSLIAQNVALTFEPNGATRRYAKQHLIVGFEKLVPGHEPGLLGNGRAVEICKDMDYPQTVRADAIAGSVTIMYVPAWDFVRDASTHASMAIFRGVENGFAVVRSARNGLMTVSDAQGRVVARAVSRAGPVLVVASVAPGAGTSVYRSIGDVFAWLSIVTAIGLGVAALRGLTGLPPPL